MSAFLQLVVSAVYLESQVYVARDIQLLLFICFLLPVVLNRSP